MVLTYHEAERRTAAVFDEARDQWLPQSADVLARMVLEAVGYADLLTEVENLRLTVGEDVWIMDRDDAEVERLRYVESDLASAREAGRSYRRQRDELRTERDALAATLARIKALIPSRMVRLVFADEISAALEQC